MEMLTAMAMTPKQKCRSSLETEEQPTMITTILMMGAAAAIMTTVRRPRRRQQQQRASYKLMGMFLLFLLSIPERRRKRRMGKNPGDVRAQRVAVAKIRRAQKRKEEESPHFPSLQLATETPPMTGKETKVEVCPTVKITRLEAAAAAAVWTKKKWRERGTTSLPMRWGRKERRRMEAR